MYLNRRSNMIQRKYIIISVITFIILCCLYFILIVYPRLGKIPVQVLVYPEDAKIFINGKVSSSGTIYMSADTYTFTAKKTGWIDDEVTATISEDLQSIALLPTPTSEEAHTSADTPGAATRREELAGIAANTRGLSIRKKYPIINKIPHSDLTGPFKIDYGFNQDDRITPYIIVSFATPHGRKEAIKWLKKNGADITATEIIFENFKNPLSTKQEINHE